MDHLDGYVDSCNHLFLKPSARGRDMARIYMWYFTDPKESKELDDEDIKEYANGLLSIDYEPHCSKTNEICVVMESPVISRDTEGNLYSL